MRGLQLSPDERLNKLNEYFNTYIDNKPEIFSQEELMFPLHIYDDTLFNEIMSLPSDFPMDACILLQDLTPESTLKEKGLGIWYYGTVLSIPSQTSFVVEINGQVMPMPRLYVSFQTDPLDIYVTRITKALEKRANSIALMKYYFIIKQMPFDERIITSLGDIQLERISKRARSNARIKQEYLDPVLQSTLRSKFSLFFSISFSCLLSFYFCSFILSFCYSLFCYYFYCFFPLLYVLPSALHVSLFSPLPSRSIMYISNMILCFSSETKLAYEETMKKILFDSTVFHRSNVSIYTELHLPLALVALTTRDSIPGIVTLQQYKQETIRRIYESDGYLSSPAAIHALQGTVVENLRIKNIKLLELTYSKSMQLDKFDRMFQEMMATAGCLIYLPLCPFSLFFFFFIIIYIWIGIPVNVSI